MRKKIPFYMYIYAAPIFVRTLKCGSKMRAFSDCRNSFISTKSTENFLCLFLPTKKTAKAKVLLNSNFFLPFRKYFEAKHKKAKQFCPIPTHTCMNFACCCIFFFLHFHVLYTFIQSAHSFARIHIAGRISL